jgi:predicted KAP-like P-loop ATPase
MPRTDGRHDRLNRGVFADRIAGVLLGLPKGSGLTIGIHGPWGNGKTTVLDIIREKIIQIPLKLAPTECLVHRHDSKSRQAQNPRTIAA